MGQLNLTPHSINMKAVLALSCLAVASALPYPMAFPPMPNEPVQRFPRQGGDDQVYAADTAYGAAPVGRVKIQVYRGPSKGTGYDAFAPLGILQHPACRPGPAPLGRTLMTLT